VLYLRQSGPVQTDSELVHKNCTLVRSQCEISVDWTGLDLGGSSLDWSAPGPLATLGWTDNELGVEYLVQVFEPQTAAV
jgi:hypothetical protein